MRAFFDYYRVAPVLTQEADGGIREGQWWRGSTGILGVQRDSLLPAWPTQGKGKGCSRGMNDNYWDFAVAPPSMLWLCWAAPHTHTHTHTHVLTCRLRPRLPGFQTVGLSGYPGYALYPSVQLAFRGRERTIDIETCQEAGCGAQYSESPGTVYYTRCDSLYCAAGKRQHIID